LTVVIVVLTVVVLVLCVLVVGLLRAYATVLARLHQLPFTDRLVRKFDLPVEGWRGRRSRP